MLSFLHRFHRDECGATSIEYALIAAFIGLVIITAAANVGTEVQGTFTDVQKGMQKRPSV